MTPEAWKRAKGVLSEALEQVPEERAAFIAQACGDDGALREEVERLIEADAAPDVIQGPGDAIPRLALPESSAGADRGRAEEVGATMVGRRIGEFTITRLIGIGGMGAVYEAEQGHPARTVALKLLRWGLASKSSLKRFEFEAQLLGRLQHPGIAQVFAAGVQVLEGASLPYFAMELVPNARALGDHAAAHNLGVRARIGLFIRVCGAVQHGHLRGVVHRDLKPSNILVHQDEAGARPKIIDFGVARATDSDIAATTLATDANQLIGTIQYMSPEQCAGGGGDGGSAGDIDVRSDVYALGVVLYELLTGRLPYDLSGSHALQAPSIIREKPPLRPSTVAPGVRGDLEIILLKALEKDRDRRYQSAEELADDLERYLSGQAIQARPISRTYQARMFVRRNRTGVAAGGLTVGALVLGLAGTAWQARTAARERDAARAAEAETDKRAGELKRVSDFQSQMLSQVDTGAAGKLLTRDVMARLEAALVKAKVADDDRAEQVRVFGEHWKRVNATDAARGLIDGIILKPAVAAVGKQFKDQPVVDAALRQVLAERYEDLSLSEAALPLQQQALETRRRELGNDDRATLYSINGMGNVLMNMGKYAEAEPYYREALEGRRRALGEDDAETLNSIGNLGTLIRAQGKLAEAEPYYREALEKKRRVLGEDHLETLGAIGNMGFLLKELGKLDEAEAYTREAVEKKRRVLGNDDSGTLTSINNLSILLLSRGRPAEAEPFAREALEGRRRVMGEDHSHTLGSIGNLGILLKDLGRLDEAEPYYREALDRLTAAVGEENPATLNALNNLGYLLQAQGKFGEAELRYREALDKHRRFLNPDNPRTLTVMNNLGGLFQAQGKWSEAEAYFRQVLDRQRVVLPENHPSTLLTTGNLGAVLEAQGRHEEAARVLAPAVDPIRKVTVGSVNIGRFSSVLANLGKARTAMGEFAPAEANLLEAHAVLLKLRGPAHSDTCNCAKAIAALYTAWDGGDPGKGHDAAAAEWAAKTVAPEAPEQGVPSTPR